MTIGCRYHRALRGAFLLEVVIASFLFIAVLGAITTVWAHHDRALSLTKKRSVAELIAEKTMNLCLANGFYHVDEMATMGPRVTEVVQEIDEVEIVAQYETSVDVDLQADGDLKLITVLVEFEERGIDKQVSLHHVLYWQN